MKIPKIKMPRFKMPAKKWIVFSIVSASSAVLALVCLVLFSSSGKSLRSQQAASVWAGDSGQKYAQISVFAPSDGGLDTGKIMGFRQKVTEATADTTAKNVVNPYVDAWSARGTVSISGDHGSTDASVTATGGDFFVFHPLDLVSGSYYSDDDLMKDRVLLDEELAWKLFGGTDLAGMYVSIGGKPFVVAGVVSREDDKYDKAAYSGGAGLYMPYNTYAALTSSPSQAPGGGAAGTTGTGTGTGTGAGAGTAAGGGAAQTPAQKPGITCYEIVMPNPVTAFASGLAAKELNADGKYAVIDNSARFGARQVFNNVIKNAGKRAMRTDAIGYPYWENAARLAENRAGFFLLMELIFWLCPIVFAVIVLVVLFKYLKKRAKIKFVDLKDRYDNRTLFPHMKGSDEDGGTDA